MQLKTRSKFYFGFEVTKFNRSLRLQIGPTLYDVNIPVGYFSMTNIASNLQAALNDLEVLTFTVSVNRSTRVFTISAPSNFSLLWSQTPLIGQLLGFNATNQTGASSYSGQNAAGIEFKPQFVLLDYVPPENWKKTQDKTVNVSGSGKVEVVRFGVTNFLEFKIDFQTNNKMPESSWIESDLQGYERVRTFMQEITKKGELEFMPDRDNPSEFYTMLLESTEEDRQGTDFRLNEMTSRGLIGFYSTGKLVFRLL